LSNNLYSLSLSLSIFSIIDDDDDDDEFDIFSSLHWLADALESSRSL
jgi:hypothetical protein